jgi:hypothetical protein
VQLLVRGRRSRLGLKGQQHLEQRMAAEVALRRQMLDQLLEGQLLVGIGA